MFGDPNEMDKWPCCKVSDVADVTVGLVIKPTRFYTDDVENGVKAFRSLNVREMRVNDSDWVYFSQEGNDENKKSQLQKGDVLIVRSGYPGTSCVVTDEYVGCNAIDIIIARPKQDKINPYYLCAFNNFPHGMNQIRHGTGGAAQKHFNVGAYNKVTIPLPPKEEQDKFVEFMQQADKSKYAIDQFIKSLHAAKDATA
ncbi:type I restriction enzyme, S subunit [Selenomonas ruminantium]|uniref:Type I restriction enzyme, S subunit n=2 Tax=Selenomonas ruminantium TaxID=971 RepID=A0A1I0VB14_SELRU|nr:type I restriction enzyme, S subunit [Selenomonas ruminantium]